MSETADAVVAVAVATLWSEPGAVRPIDALICGADPDVATWLAAMSHDDRLGLLGRIETQTVMGDPVRVLDERGGWAAVELPDQPSRKGRTGYPGWVPAAQLCSAPARRAPVATISVPVATASAQRSEVALSYGTRLVVEERTEDRLRLRIPTGEVLEVAAAACRPQPATGAALVAAARGLGGLAYLWGGCSGFGLDCSGLTHLTHRVAGRRVPRDADEQAGSGLAVGAERAAVGDLLFFARSGEGVHHVGFSAGLGRLLHSPRTGRTVEEISLDVAPYRDELVALARRYVGVGTAAQPSMNTSGGT